ncbi:MAG: hypothetical protein WCD79_13385 [Chthoniobacteraceae bacterium]
MKNIVKSLLTITAPASLIAAVIPSFATAVRNADPATATAGVGIRSDSPPQSPSPTPVPTPVLSSTPAPSPTPPLTIAGMRP